MQVCSSGFCYNNQNKKFINKSRTISHVSYHFMCIKHALSGDS